MRIAKISSCWLTKVKTGVFRLLLFSVLISCGTEPVHDSPASQLEYKEAYEELTEVERNCRDLALEAKLSLRTNLTVARPKIDSFCNVCNSVTPALCEFLILNTVARRALAEGEMNSAQNVFRRQALLPGIVDAKNAFDARYRYMALDQLISFAINTSRYDTALHLGRQMLAESIATKDSLFVLYSYLRIGTSLTQLGETEIGAKYIDTANDITLRHGTPITKASRFLELSQSDVLDSKDLVHYAHLARKLLAENAPNYIWWAYGSLARAHVLAERYDSAQHYAILVFDQPRVEPSLAVVAYRSLYSVSESKGKFDLAARYLDSALVIAQENADTQELIALTVNQAELFESQNNYPEAYASYLEASQLLAADSIINENSRVAYLGLMRIAGQLDRDIPPPVLSMAAEVQDSMLKRTERSTLARLQQQFNDKERLDQIESLDNIRTAQAVALTNRNYALAGGGLALILLTAGGLALYRQRNNLKHANARVTTLNRELNHRSANQINLAYQLIRNQQRKLKNEAARSALQQSEAQLMALKTVNQRLAHAADDRVRADEVLTEVAENLQAASPRPFDLQLELSPIELPAQELTKVSLVVNELIANSIKYAFTDSHTGNVQLSLKQTAGATELRYADDGPGKDGNVRGSGVGSGLIEVLLKDLEAKVWEENTGGYQLSASW